MRWSINGACQEWDVSLKTLKRKLASAGHTIEKGAKFSTLQICAALYGDKEREQTLEIVERRKALQYVNAKTAGDLVEMQEVVRLYSEAILPIRARLNALPSECSVRCNPHDPQFAREALQVWSDDALRQIRSQLPKK